jgi:hypothetical protein
VQLWAGASKAARICCKLVRLAAGMRFINDGGGLGIDGARALRFGGFTDDGRDEAEVALASARMATRAAPYGARRAMA